LEDVILDYFSTVTIGQLPSMVGYQSILTIKSVEFERRTQNLWKFSLCLNSALITFLYTIY